jgi:hypothetical protein
MGKQGVHRLKFSVDYTPPTGRVQPESGDGGKGQTHLRMERVEEGRNPDHQPDFAHEPREQNQLCKWLP